MVVTCSNAVRGGGVRSVRRCSMWRCSMRRRCMRSRSWCAHAYGLCIHDHASHPPSSSRRYSIRYQDASNERSKNHSREPYKKHLVEAVSRFFGTRIAHALLYSRTFIDSVSDSRARHKPYHMVYSELRSKHDGSMAVLPQEPHMVEASGAKRGSVESGSV